MPQIDNPFRGPWLRYVLDGETFEVRHGGMTGAEHKTYRRLTGEDAFEVWNRTTVDRLLTLHWLLHVRRISDETTLEHVLDFAADRITAVEMGADEKDMRAAQDPEPSGPSSPDAATGPTSASSTDSDPGTTTGSPVTSSAATSTTSPNT